MEEIKLNLENLTESEREQLLTLIQKANTLKNQRWVPNDGQEYYTILADGAFDWSIWDNDEYNIGCLSIGNVFRTEKEAQEAVTALKIRTRWRELSIESGEDKNWWNGARFHYYPVFYATNNQISVNWTVETRCTDIYFASQASCQAAIKELGEENVKKYILNIKD